MANVNVTSDSWTEISITSGTIQNISATADIELSAEQTDNSGVVLKPSEIYQWDNETIYARAVTESQGALRVVNFKKAAGGGGYVLPVASASTLGGVKVGSNLSIDEDGVLSATGGGAVNYSTTEQQIGTWIDGKPLYQKTFVGSYSPVSPPRVLEVEIDGDCSYIDLIVGNDVCVCTVDKYFAFDSYYDTNYYISLARIKTATDNKLVLYISKDWSAISQNYFVTIKYTKTTD